jgi:hypothetical protein
LNLFFHFLNPRVLDEFVYFFIFWLWLQLEFMMGILITISKHHIYVGRCTDRMDRYRTSK